MSNWTTKDWYQYTGSDGVATYAILLRRDYGLLASLGFTTFDPDDAPMPRRMRPRYVYVHHPTDGRTRKIPVGAITADVWTGVAATITLYDVHDAVGAAWVIGRKYDEILPDDRVIHGA